MAHYSTFVFQLPNCPEIHMTTRYSDIMDLGSNHMRYRHMCTKPNDVEPYPRVTLTRWQRRKVQTFLNVIYQYGNHNVPRRWRKYVKNDGVCGF